MHICRPAGAEPHEPDPQARIGSSTIHAQRCGLGKNTLVGSPSCKENLRSRGMENLRSKNSKLSKSSMSIISNFKCQNSVACRGLTGVRVLGGAWCRGDRRELAGWAAQILCMVGSALCAFHFRGGPPENENDIPQRETFAELHCHQRMPLDNGCCGGIVLSIMPRWLWLC